MTCCCQKECAWRVALGEAAGGALAAACSDFGFARSSLLMEGIEELKA